MGQPESLSGKHFFAGIQDLCRLGHKVHPAEDYYRAFCPAGLYAQLQGITHKVSNVLHLAYLVVVCQYDSIFFCFQFFYFSGDISISHIAPWTYSHILIKKK